MAVNQYLQQYNTKDVFGIDLVDGIGIEIWGDWDKKNFNESNQKLGLVYPICHAYTKDALAHNDTNSCNPIQASIAWTNVGMESNSCWKWTANKGTHTTNSTKNGMLRSTLN